MIVSNTLSGGHFQAESCPPKACSNRQDSTEGVANGYPRTRYVLMLSQLNIGDGFGKEQIEKDIASSMDGLEADKASIVKLRKELAKLKEEVQKNQVSTP